MTTVKITELSDIGANLATSTVVPVVNMAGTPITQKTNIGNIANLILEGAGVDYPEATVALLAQTVSNAAQPNITSVGTLTNVAVSGNATVNGNITSNGTAYLGNISTTGDASITTLQVGASANLGAVGNVTITGGTAGQLLSTNGNGVLSWASDATSYGNSNVANYLPTFTGNIGANVVTANLFSGNGTNLTNIAGANVSGFVPNANVANTAFSVAAANVSGLGNIATINLTGSNSNVLYGNGVFAAVAGGANTGNVTFNDINIIGTGNLHLQPDPANANSYLDVFLSSGPDIHIVASQSANLILGKDNQSNVMTSWDGNVYVQSWNQNTGNVGGIWAFGGDGTTTFPTANIDLHNGGVQSGEVLQFGNPNLQSIITGPTPSANVNAQRIIIQGQSGNGQNSEGGDVYVWAGDAQINGGDIKIYAGDADNASAGSGGYINLAGGDGFDNGGDITLNGGSSANGYGGQISITGGTGQIDGGPASITGGYGATGSGGAVNITGGSSSVGPSSYGNVEIGSGIYGWSFNNTGNLVLPGNTFAVNYANGTAVTIPTVGNIATIDLTGSNSNVLYGNGVFAPTISGNLSQISNGNSNVTLTDTNGNVYINTNGGTQKQWIFDTAGNLRTPGNVDIYGAINFPQQVSSLNWSTYNIELSQYGRINTNVDFFANANTIGALYLKGDGSNISNIAVANIVGLGNIATANLTGSNTNVLYGNGVFAAVAGGNANTGNVTFDDNIVIGTGDEFGSAGLFLAPGNGSIANSAVQYLRVRGGDAPTHIHLDTGNNQYYDQYFGDDAKYVKLELGDAGNVVVGTDDATGNSYRWTFTSGGNLILADGNSVIQSIANSSLDPTLPNVSTMTLTPDQNYNSQALVLDPTAPGHIHLRAYAFSNIDDPAANIFLGGEDTAFEVTSGANNEVRVHSGGNTWTFNNAGNLIFPRDAAGNIDPILSIVGGATPTIVSTAASLAGPANLAIQSNYLNLSGFTGEKITFFPDDGLISTDFDMVLTTNVGGGNTYTWTLDATGNLNLPGNLVIAGNANVFGTNSSLLQTTDNRPLLALSSGANGAVSSLWVEDIGNVGTSNIAAVYANPTSGSKIVRIAVGQNGGNTGPNLWDFGTTGILTLPQGSQISETANTSVNITANANTWAFGVDGNLTVPGSIINDTSIVLSAPAIFNICTIATAGSGYNTGSSLKATTGGSGTGMTVGIGYGLSNQLTSVNVVNPGTGYVNGDVITVSEGTGGTFVITKYNVLANQTNNNTIQTDLTFVNNTLTLPVDGNLVGNLIVPGSIISSGASPAPYISGFSSVSALQFKNGNSNVTVNANSNLWTFDSTGNLTLPANAFAINYANGTQVSLGGGNVTWAQIEDKDGNSGPTIITLGQNAGFDGQGNAAIAIGKNAGAGGQGASSITIGEDAGGNTTQGSGAIAIGSSAGYDAQGLQAVAIGLYAGTNTQGQYSVAIGGSAGATSQGQESVAVGVNSGSAAQGIGAVSIGASSGASSQGNTSVAIGTSSGALSQGANAVAIGYLAGYQSQGNNSIILNATGANLNQTVANTFTVAPVRNDVSNIAEVMFYNATSKEVTYGNTISVAGNITGGNIIGNGNTLSNVATKTSGSWTLASGVNTVNISVPLNGTYALWVNGNIPNGIITYTATAVITNTNVPVLGSQYAWYYAVGNALVFTSIPDQFVGTVGSISNVNTYAGNTANVFTFGITNNSGNTAVVNYGYTKL